MRRSILPSVACLPLPNCSTFSQKGPISEGVGGGGGGGGKLLNIKCADLIFSSTFV